jgi:hypothetical protein
MLSLAPGSFSIVSSLFFMDYPSTILKPLRRRLSGLVLVVSRA